MATNELKDNENIFRRDIYEVISPYKDHDKIFNKKDFDIKFLNSENGRKIIFIRRREEELNNNEEND